MQNENFIASAVKVTAVNAGAVVSTMTNTGSGSISAVAGTLAATYSAVQLFKALPWITDYICAMRDGFFRHDWSHWRRIARKEETGDADNTKS
jgi:hypothetical protein